MVAHRQVFASVDSWHTKGQRRPHLEAVLIIVNHDDYEALPQHVVPLLVVHPGYKFVNSRHVPIPHVMFMNGELEYSVNAWRRQACGGGRLIHVVQPDSCFWCTACELKHCCLHMSKVSLLHVVLHARQN